MNTKRTRVEIISSYASRFQAIENNGHLAWSEQNIQFRELQRKLDKELKEYDSLSELGRI